MIQKPLYKYGNAVGPRCQSPGDPIHGYRLIAEVGMILTDEIRYVECVDVLVDEVSRWKEVEFFPGNEQ